MGKRGPKPTHASHNSDRLMVRLSPDVYQKLTEVMPGQAAGTIDPNEARRILATFAENAAAVKAGTLTPEAAGMSFKAYFTGYFASLASGQPGEPGEDDKPG